MAQNIDFEVATSARSRKRRAMRRNCSYENIGEALCTKPHREKQLASWPQRKAYCVDQNMDVRD